MYNAVCSEAIFIHKNPFGIAVNKISAIFVKG